VIVSVGRTLMRVPPTTTIDSVAAARQRLPSTIAVGIGAEHDTAGSCVTMESNHKKPVL
jgi:hypothetical protein